MIALSALVGALLAGVLGGAHCLAMCGGFVAAFSAGATTDPAPGVPLVPLRTLVRRQLAYNGGRIATYALLGAIAGGAGGALLAAADWLPLQRLLYVIANVFLLALAVTIAWKREGFVWLQRVGSALFAKALPAVRPLLGTDTLVARVALGMIWGLVPCALTYSVLPIALFAGGAWQGAAVMAAFGIGTLPSLLVAGWAVSRAGRALETRAVRLGAAALLAGFAAVGLWRALASTAALAQGAFCL